MSNKEPLEFDDLNPRPRDLDDEAAKQISGGWGRGVGWKTWEQQNPDKTHKAIRTSHLFNKLFKKKGG